MIDTPTQISFSKISKKMNEIRPLLETLGGALTYKKVEKNGNMISTKFFNSNNDIISKRDIDNVLMFLHQAIQNFIMLGKELSLEKDLNTTQKTILINLIKSSILNLNKLKYATYIEAEKGGYKLDKIEKNEYILKIDEIDTILYGKKVSDSKEEISIILNHLDKAFIKNKQKLTKDEINNYLSFKNNFPSYTGGNNENKKIVNNSKVNSDNNKDNKLNEINDISIEYFTQIIKKTFDIYSIDSIIVDISDEYLEYNINKDGILCIPGKFDQYKIDKIYKEFCIDQKIKIIMCPDANNVTVRGLGKEFIIPKKYGKLDLKTICGLLDHEIGTHWITFLNNEKTLNILSNSYQKIQEGVAVLNQELIDKSIEDIDINTPRIGNISVLIGENNDFDNTKKLLKIYFKLTTDWTDKKIEEKAQTRALRIKRLHPFDMKGANRKDVIYWRGLFDIIQYIKNTDYEEIKNMANIFNKTRLGHEELISASDELFEGINKDDDTIIMPIAIGKILYNKLTGGNIDNNQPDLFLSNKIINIEQAKKIVDIKNYIKKVSLLE